MCFYEVVKVVSGAGIVLNSRLEGLEAGAYVVAGEGMW